jgi:hypothetical protein
LMYPFGLVYAATIGPASTPPTVLVGAVMLVVGGGWMAWSVLRRSSAETAVSAAAMIRGEEISVFDALWLAAISAVSLTAARYLMNRKGA